MHRREGFTIVELAIVCAVIAIVVAVALPAIQQSRQAANEASAIASLHAFVIAQEQYSVRYGRYAGVLGDLKSADLVDDSFRNTAILERTGYRFFYLPAASPWEIRAVPMTPGTTGTRYFTVSERGAIHFSTLGPATLSDPQLD